MWFLLFCITIGLVCGQDTRYALNILHYNDFHARFVETSPWGSTCNPESAPCIGGFARLATVVRQRLAAEPQSLLLNGGDSFQGTIWYNLLRWNVTQDFMNMLPHDAHVLGNHEFDNGIEGLVPYLQTLNAPMVTANIIDDLEPTIQGLYKPSIVVERNGRRIGIIGVLVSITDNISASGKLVFTEEVSAVKVEAEKLNAEGVDIIIVLSHCGLDIDRQIALNGGPYIDIIVGGHSHSLLYNEEPPVHSAFVPEGPYPIVVDQENRKVLIVQAAAHTQYLGEIKLFFDDAGNLLEWAGDPHYIWLRPSRLEYSCRRLNEDQRTKRLANLWCIYLLFVLAPNAIWAMELAEEGHWHYAHFCLLPRGAIRTDIQDGVVTFESAINVTPFENFIEVFELKGEHIMEVLEYAMAADPWPGARMVQASGLRAVFDGSLPLNSRVLNVTIRCIECDVPRYEPLDLDKYYRVVTQAYMGEGGDGFTMMSENRRNVRVVGLDYVILMDYIRKQSPIFSDLDGRIDINNACL